MTEYTGEVASRNVVNVILDFRRVLSDARPEQCPDVAAEYICDLFDGSAAAVNLMDYGRFRFQTITNVGRLSSSERRSPSAEFYAFTDFPFTTQRLAAGGAYRAALADVDCPEEYRELLTATFRTDCLGAPIRHGARALGELWVSRDSGQPFADVDEDLAVACGATLARYFPSASAVAG